MATTTSTPAAAAASGPDPLFDVKNAFYLGNWQQSLNEAQKAKTTTEEQKLERDIFMYRAYTAQRKYGVVSSEIRDDSAPAPLLAVKLLAKYFSQPSTAAKSAIAEQIDSHLDEYTGDSLSALIAATIYYYEQNFDTALKVLHSAPADLECMALSVQIYLQLDRLDLAKKECKRLCERDEYCTLAQLSLAWVYLFVAGEKLQDAFFIYQELKDKYGATPLLLNGQAACLVGQGKYTEADPLVQEAVDKDPNYQEAIINQMVLAQFQGKSAEVVSRLLAQLRTDDHQAPGAGLFAADFAAKEREFDKIALQYQA